MRTGDLQLRGNAMNNAAAITATDNAIALLQIIHVAIDALPTENKLADGIALTLDNLAVELDRARTALG